MTNARLRTLLALFPLALAGCPSEAPPGTADQAVAADLAARNLGVIARTAEVGDRIASAL